MILLHFGQFFHINEYECMIANVPFALGRKSSGMCMRSTCLVFKIAHNELISIECIMVEWICVAYIFIT